MIGHWPHQVEIKLDRTTAYFLDTALIEAKLQEQHIIDDTAIARAKPGEVWRPLEDRD